MHEAYIVYKPASILVKIESIVNYGMSQPWEYAPVHYYSL